ncbi:polysaccharide deacetylase family protein [Bradyrhizobium sp. CW10]|uniref:polysaccharide deacetylase family protein n=1 Tax=Bradyrhizobium sp. CW10 TaxID=2782683 RepID=UPI001FFA98FC|nr:polysaccharide deacetylase family protein [Bradyrhizobium sp. CW10]
MVFGNAAGSGKGGGVAHSKTRLLRLTTPLAGAVTLLLAGIVVTDAADCPRQDVLGTSRVLEVDAKAHARVGLNSFRETLPLADHEVVLTFDDGPRPPSTQKVLAALAKECVRATFFLVGKSSAKSPELVRRIAAEGHTIAHHSWSHTMMSKMTFEQAKKDIDRGIAADETALKGASAQSPPSRFFRFPYFDSSPAMLEFLRSRGMVVFGADLSAGDWENLTPEQELKTVTERLEVASKGIILLHDAQARTAAMMPAFLRYLHENGYRIVHLVPAGPIESNAEVTPAASRSSSRK